MERKACALLREALEASASLRVSAEDPTDAIIRLRGGDEIPLELVLWHRSEEARNNAGNRVWILPNAPRTLHDRLRKRQESFVDLRGTVHLTFPNLLVDRNDVSLPARSRTEHRSFDPFANRSSLVVRTLLEADDATHRTWGVRELADAAGVGPATATRAVRGLSRLRVITTERKGRRSEIRLTDPRGLFTAWASTYDWTRNERITVAAPIGDPTRFLKRLAAGLAPRRWALAMHAGASLVAPHAAWERVHAYVDVDDADDLLAVAEQQGWPAAEDGRLVLMRPYYRDSVWHRMREASHLPIVSDLQLALDLWHYPLRGREQAEHIIAARQLLT